MPPRVHCLQPSRLCIKSSIRRRPASNSRPVTGGSSTAKDGAAASPSSSLTTDERYAIQREADRAVRNKAIDKLQYRKWTNGDVYAPHDLTSIEQKKWSRSQRPSVDAFDVLSMDPLEQYTNFSIMSEYMTETGRIRPSSQTGLRRVNQRKIAKAIRRSIGIGLMPSVYHHPEIILKRMQDRA